MSGGERDALIDLGDLDGTLETVVLSEQGFFTPTEAASGRLADRLMSGSLGLPPEIESVLRLGDRALFVGGHPSPDGCGVVWELWVSGAPRAVVVVAPAHDDADPLFRIVGAWAVGGVVSVGDGR